jgi:translation initiation factor 3 subunit D
MNKYNSQYGAGGTQYAYYHEEDENSFQLVDTSRTMRPMFGRGRFFRGRGNFRGRWNNAAALKASNANQLQVLSKAQKNKERYSKHI